MAARKSTPISLRAYAARRGVSVQAVSKAIAAGRLSDSVVEVDGKPKIGDAELADREWDANTRPQGESSIPPEADENGEPLPNLKASRAWREHASMRRETALAKLAEIEVDEKLGELVSVSEARADVTQRFTVVKNKILGVPSWLAQQFPEHAAVIVPALEARLCEVLEELAAGPDDGDVGDEA